MPLLPTQRASGTKQIVCTHCGHASEVGKRAMSIFCPKCHKRVIVEDLKITSYYAVSEFATAGDVVVERKGFVVAPIRADKVTVKGRVQGAIDARGWVRVRKTGRLKGDITAPAILIEEGAAIDGFLCIGAPQSGVEVPEEPAPKVSGRRARRK